MSDIQISDLNPSDIEFCEELTDEELLAINGGQGWISDKLHDAADAIDRFGDRVGNFIKDVF